MTKRHWAETAYKNPLFQRRLDEVKKQITEALDECPPGPLRIISICSGDGRDILGVLPDHPRRQDAVCLLIDANAKAIADARSGALAAGVEKQFHCIVGDAACLDHYAEFGPANLILISGVFVYLLPSDAEKLIAALPMLCQAGCFVIWNRRHSQSPGIEIFFKRSTQIEHLQTFFRFYNFTTVTDSSTGAEGFVVRRERFDGAPKAWSPGPLLFKFFRPVPSETNNLPRSKSPIQKMWGWLSSALPLKTQAK
jgi:hypothetical protein